MNIAFELEYAHSKPKLLTIYNSYLEQDLRHNLFDKAFIERGSEDKYKEGLYLFRLLKQENGKPVGKIYCAYNGYDYALAASTSVGGNWVTRMGTVGVGTYDHWWWGLG